MQAREGSERAAVDEARPSISIRDGRCVIDLERAAEMTKEELTQLAARLKLALSMFPFKQVVIDA